MSRKLLTRPSARPAARSGSATPATRPATPAAVSVSPSSTRVLRRPVVLAVVAVGAVVVGGLGWMQLTSSSGPDAAAPASVLIRPRATAPASAGTAAGSPTTADDVPVGRDPFAKEPAPVLAAPTTPPHVVETATPSPSDPAATTQPTLTDGVAPQPSATGTASARPSVTVTVTTPGSPTYVGLYAWNGSRASFRVNARTYSVHVGTKFGPGLQFTAVVRGDPPCARVTHAKGSFTLCPGQVTTLP